MRQISRNRPQNERIKSRKKYRSKGIKFNSKNHPTPSRTLVTHLISKNQLPNDALTLSGCAAFLSDPDAFLSNLPDLQRTSAIECLKQVWKHSGINVSKDNRISSTFDLSKIKRYPVKFSGFPETDENRFSQALLSKKEFAESFTDFSGKTIEDLCPGENKPFAMFPYQRFLVNYISPLTPYRGLLIFHGVGAGKTNTAIMIAESFKSALQSNPFNPSGKY